MVLGPFVEKAVHSLFAVHFSLSVGFAGSPWPHSCQPLPRLRSSFLYPFLGFVLQQCPPLVITFIHSFAFCLSPLQSV